MSKSKPRVLVMINPGASRAETAVPALSSWFSENCDALIVVANSKKERKRELKAHGKKADLIVIGGGDGTISKALPSSSSSKNPSPCYPSGRPMISPEQLACPPIRCKPPRSR
jgi:diacylglycerol kinase family enzyme